MPIALAIVCGFLSINVALGLFGVIWYSTNRRKAEIGLRRALGANTRAIYAQIIGETLALATVGIVFGCFLAFQFPILDVIGFIEDSVYYYAFAASIIGIYAIAAICALYPSWLAARIQPAEALHNE
jgi:putative ABC transport system permease protein